MSKNRTKGSILTSIAPFFFFILFSILYLTSINHQVSNHNSQGQDLRLIEENRPKKRNPLNDSDILKNHEAISSKNSSSNPQNNTKKSKNDPDSRIRTFPIYGNYTLGYYFLDVYVGIKAQKQSLILDSGSSVTTFPCKGNPIFIFQQKQNFICYPFNTL